MQEKAPKYAFAICFRSAEASIEYVLLVAVLVDLSEHSSCLCEEKLAKPRSPRCLKLIATALRMYVTFPWCSQNQQFASFDGLTIHLATWYTMLLLSIWDEKCCGETRLDRPQDLLLAESQVFRAEGGPRCARRISLLPSYASILLPLTSYQRPQYAPA